MKKEPTTYYLPPTTYYQRGFTLVELLIFVAIFSLIAGTFLSFLVSTTRVQVRQSANVEVNQQSQFLLQTIQRYVEQSSLVEMATSTPSSTLKLRMASSSLDPTLIYLANNVIYLQQATTTPVALTSNRVNITSLSFVKRSNLPLGHDSVSVAFTMAYNAPSVFQQFAQSLDTSVARVSAATFDSNLVPSVSNTYKLGTASGDWLSINNTLFFSSGGNVGIGASNPNSLLDLSGAMTFRGISAPATSTTGQAVLYYDTSANALKLSQNAGAFASLGASQWTTSSTSIYYNTGNVGIGTTSPTQLLAVNGSAQIGSALTHSLSVGLTQPTTNTLNQVFAGMAWLGGQTVGNGESNVGSNLYYNSGFKYRYTGFASNIRFNGGNIELQTAPSGTADATTTLTTGLILQQSTGNVGIGTTGPGNKLEVSGANSTVGIRLSGATTGYNLMRVNNTGGDAYFGVTDSVGTSGITSGLAYATILYSNNATALQLGTQAAVRLTIDSTGNVGIGTTNPGGKLEVSGGQVLVQGNTPTAPQLTLRGTGAVGTGNDAIILFWTPTNARTIYLDESDSNKLKFTGGGMTDQVTIDNNGAVGIGTTNPGINLLLAGAVANMNGVNGQANTAGYVGVYGVNTNNSGTGYVAFFSSPNAANGQYLANGGVWVAISDERLKTDIAPVPNALEKLSQIQGVSFRWKTGTSKTYGLIAQNVQQVFPEMVSTSPDGYLGVEYTALISPLIQGVNELNQKIQAMLQGAVRFVKLVADVIEAHTLRADYIIAPHGITTNDAATGAPYCMRVANGQVQAVAGECE